MCASGVNISEVTLVCVKSSEIIIHYCKINVWAYINIGVQHSKTYIKCRKGSFIIMPDQKSIIGNKHLGLHINKYGTCMHISLLPICTLAISNYYADSATFVAEKVVRQWLVWFPQPCLQCHLIPHLVWHVHYIVWQSYTEPALLNGYR